MLDSALRVRNFCWPGESRGNEISPERDPAGLRGQFSFALDRNDGKVTLVRDRLGLNKLFFAIHESGRVHAANYLIDLVQRGIPFEAIYSVPAGHSLLIDPPRRTLSLSRYFDLESLPAPETAESESPARAIRNRLESWFRRIAEQYGDRKIAVCLSGGLDSGMIGAFARKYFSDVTAYTYGFQHFNQIDSDDVRYAERLAAFLKIPFRLIPAATTDILEALDNAICYGQDWRDFNVHCAIVNEIVARAIRNDSLEGERPLVLTGDLANEFLADYTPVSYRGHEYYRLPRVEPGELRLALIRGLDTGDREIGVFNHYGLDVIQPYGLLLDEYLNVPASSLRDVQCKQTLTREIAGDLLPDFVFERKKVRAQVGSADAPVGILPVLVEHGRDSGWLRSAFCRLLGIDSESLLGGLIRAGRYRSITGFPIGWRVNGYCVG